MKHFLIIILGTLLISSCRKEDPILPNNVNSIADDLKLIIFVEQIEALQYCCVGCSCSQSLGWGTDYSFPGDNFVRIKNQTYNLNRLEYYTIISAGLSPNTEKRLVLYFPQ